MALLCKEEGDYNHEDKRSNKAQRANTCRNLKRYIPLVSLIVAKFGGHVLHYLASSLSSVIRQMSRQTI